jgi:hypothetical protein
MTKEFDNLFLKPDAKAKKPFLEGKTYLVNGEIRTWDGPSCNVRSPVLNQNSDEDNILGIYMKEGRKRGKKKREGEKREGRKRGKGGRKGGRKRREKGGRKWREGRRQEMEGGKEGRRGKRRREKRRREKGGGRREERRREERREKGERENGRERRERREYPTFLGFGIKFISFLLGSYPMMTGPAVLEVLDASVKAYNNGRGRLFRSFSFDIYSFYLFILHFFYLY